MENIVTVTIEQLFEALDDHHIIVTCEGDGRWVWVNTDTDVRSEMEFPDSETAAYFAAEQSGNDYLISCARSYVWDNVIEAGV